MQRELFNDFTGVPEDKSETASSPSKSPSLFESLRVTLTLDKMILGVLVNMVALVVVYSVALERGVKMGQERAAAFTATEERGAQMDVIPPAAERTPPPPARPEQAAADPVMLSGQESPAAPAAVVLLDGRYTIQLVTYEREERAKKEVEKLGEKGHRAFIIPSGKFYQVCIETFPEKNLALRKLLELRSVGYERVYAGAYVRPVKR